MDTERVAEALVALEASDDRFDWVGVYWVEGEDLVLGPFVGQPTEHTRITIPNGVCGSVAAAGETEVVPDVRARPGHIACDLKTRAEVVAPIVADGMVIGVLDVDSNTLGAFAPDAVAVIEDVASLIARM